MTHRPLSLQYRPQSFAELIGQQDIIKPLLYSLDMQKIHPAYLLTGIRGIGKTTIARIIAKSLNCEQGISSTPCNTCNNCISIREGRHPDVFEIDAASRTKVEDTREVLDNIQYQPTQARFKVFIIDEVHMLSNHSFNALLKTLEEPPAHVRFVLATTDPQKIPATVISRCLQYRLLRIAPEHIVSHLISILDKENISYEQDALQEIALASECSMRDALSLLEQAIYFSQGAINLNAVHQMLGLTDRQTIQNLLKALAEKDAGNAINLVAELFNQGAQLGKVIEQLIDAIHALSIYKTAPDLVQTTYSHFADLFSHQALQIMYQACLIAKRDIDLAHSEKAALEMLLLRLMHFTPKSSNNASTPTQNAKTVEQQQQKKTVIQPSEPVATTKNNASTQNKAETKIQPIDTNDWFNVVRQLKLSGIAAEIVNHSTRLKQDENQIKLALNPKYESMVSAEMSARIEYAINQALASKLQLNIEYTDTDPQITPFEIKQAHNKAQHQSNLNEIEQDPGYQMLKNELGAQVIPETVKPIPSEETTKIED